MRKLVLLIPLAAAGLLAASLASAGQRAAEGRYSCGGKAIDLYFWPHGHPKVPAYGFPAFKPPHLEVYKRGIVANSGFLGFVSATQASFAKSCRAVGDNSTKWGGGPVKMIKVTRRVRCAFPSRVELRDAVLPAGHQLVVTLGHSTKIVVYIEIKPKGSVLDYDGRYCKASKVPGVS